LENAKRKLVSKGATVPEADAFMDMLKKMLVWDEKERLTPAQGLLHPFITGLPPVKK